MSTRADAGFTLAEMLVSLAILGMASLMLASGLWTGQRVWERAETSSNAGEAVEGAQMALRERLERVVPATRFDGSQPYADLRGGAEALQFLGPPDNAAGPGEVRRFRLAVTAGGYLTLASMSDLSPELGRPGELAAYPDRVVLLKRVRGLEIGYFGVAPPDNTLRWRSRWEDRPAPPRLIRLRLAFAPGDPRRWTDLVVRPAATVDTLCVLDAATHRCKGRA